MSSSHVSQQTGFASKFHGTNLTAKTFVSFVDLKVVELHSIKRCVRLVTILTRISWTNQGNTLWYFDTLSYNTTLWYLYFYEIWKCLVLLWINFLRDMLIKMHKDQGISFLTNNLRRIWYHTKRLYKKIRSYKLFK